MENCEIPSDVIAEEASMASGSPMSFGALVKQSTAVLNNECEALEARIEKKTRYCDELRKLCAKQGENIAKQQSELEHLIVKTHHEEIQNTSHNVKIQQLREKLEVLDKHFAKWGNIINPTLAYKNELEGIINQLKIKQEHDEALTEQLEKNNKHYLAEAENAVAQLEECKDKESCGLSGLKIHISKQLEEQKTQERKLEQELRKLQNECQEKRIMIAILEPQTIQLKKQFEKLENELESEKEQMGFTMNELQVQLEKKMQKNKRLATEIEVVIAEMKIFNDALIEKENEMKMLECKEKQMNTEEEECAKINKTRQQEVQRLESVVEGLTLQLSALMKINDENIVLEETYNEMQSTNNDYKKKITEIESSEESCSKKIVELNKVIDELEIGRKILIDEQLVVENSIKKLKHDQVDNENEHKTLSMKIGEIAAELQAENEQLTDSLGNLKEQISEASEAKSWFEKALEDLVRGLAEAEGVSQESDFKLSSYCEECNVVNKGYIEEIHMLSESMQRSIQDYEKAVLDCEINEETTKEIEKLQISLEKKRETYEQTFHQLQESFMREIENKSKAMSESRAQCEREFRSKGLMKTDALIELKETKARVIDLQKQKVIAEKDILMKKDILKKCDNLIHRLVTKFNKVALVAKTSTQSMADPASQQTSSLTPRTQRKTVKIESPGSESSGKTFNPDDVKIKKILKKRQPLRPLPTITNPEHMTKKIPFTAAPKNKNVPDQSDDWGFLG